ncbi:MAG TPA: NAD(+) diphosphatase [Bacteroidales bacterium]|nr:NAD(+) diphosphatase [Bacteroidales bacterium]
MIQDIFPHRFNNQFLTKKNIAENDYVLHYDENCLLLKIKDDVYELPKRKDFPEISDTAENTFLFTLNDVPCFLIWEKPKVDHPDFMYKEIDFFRSISQQEIAWISIAGFHLRNWYTQNKFCGKCGTYTQQKQDERALICPDCNTIIYPKISPAVIVAIICKNRILLARGSNWSGGWYSLIAGYVDIGESLEEAVIREVKEEVGLDIKNIRYYKSQPWPLSASMMIGFVAEADENQVITIDPKEIAEAAWFTRGNLPKHSLNLSIAGEMIEKFDQGENRIFLPL